MRIRTEYTLNEDGIRQRQVLRDLFFCSSDQIKLARRFVSDFVYITDATFRTNKRRFPLSIMTGITNTGHIFQFGYIYIISESAVAFKFMENKLTELIFYDRPLPKIVLRDFAKGLAAIYIADPTPIPSVDDDTELVETRDDNEAEILTSALGEAIGTRLQLCEWHAVNAIKRKLVAVGKYKKEKREELTNDIWNWVQCTDLLELDRIRTVLLDKLFQAEQRYLLSFYKPKEHQFVRAYTKSYPNLGMNSTQRGESNHYAVKRRGLNAQMPLHVAVKRIVEQTRDLLDIHRAELDQNRSSLPRLLDIKGGFKYVGHKLTHYALKLASDEWEKTKKWGQNIEDNLAPDPDTNWEDIRRRGCREGCELPSRYALPCRHWMMLAWRHKEPLPPSLFHPRWFLDEPSYQEGWTMSYRYGPAEEAEQAVISEDGDRFRNRGKDLLTRELAELEKYQDILSGPAREEFAKLVSSLSATARNGFADRLAQREAVPVELHPLIPNSGWRKPEQQKKRIRAYTGLDVEEERERSSSRRRRREAQEARAEDAERTEAASESLIIDLTQPSNSPGPQIQLGDSWHSSASASSASSVSSDEGFVSLEIIGAKAMVRDSQRKLERLDQQLYTSSSDSDDDDAEFTAVSSTRQSGRSVRPSRKIESQQRQAEAAAARDLERRRLQEAKIQLRAVKAKEKAAKKAKRMSKRRRLKAQKGSQLEDLLYDIEM
jgi:hypothetical protein